MNICTFCFRKYELGSSGVLLHNLMMNDPKASIQNENIGQISVHLIVINACFQVSFCSGFLLKEQIIYHLTV